MSDRPASKPANGASANGGSKPAFPPTKPRLYNPTRPLYRPQPPPSRRRGFCCSCCLFTTFIIVTIILLAAVSLAVLWVIYRPHRPNFAVSSLQLSRFKLTSTHLTSKFSLTLTASNPNQKITFFYDPTTVSMYSNGVDVGDGSFPDFVHGTKNTTTLRTVVASQNKNLESTDISTLKSDLKNQNSLQLKIQLDTKVKVKIGSLKTKKIGVRVTCDGINLAFPTRKSAATATTSNIKCKVDLRFKIWKWRV